MSFREDGDIEGEPFTATSAPATEPEPEAEAEADEPVDSGTEEEEAPAANTDNTADPLEYSSDWKGLDAFDFNKDVGLGAFPNVNSDLKLSVEDRKKNLWEKLNLADDDQDLFGDIALPQGGRAGVESKINAMRDALQTPLIKLEELTVEFAQEVDGEEVVIGKMSFEQAQVEEAALERTRIAAIQADLKVQLERNAAISKREKAVRDTVIELRDVSLAEISKERNQALEKEILAVKMQQADFRKHEDELDVAMKKKDGQLSVHYGGLDGEIKDMYGRIRSRTYRVSFAKAPRILRLRIDCLRALKTKLPAAHYSMMVTLYDRLGGHPLYWSKLKQDVGYNGSTPFPQYHDGQFFSRDLSFNSPENRIFLACPSKSQTRPSMCIVFELFLIADGKQHKRDTVVGWGAFPLVYANLGLVTGKFKCPLMRGPMKQDYPIDKYDLIEHSICNNLSSWLCNVYFDASVVATYVDNQPRYQVEATFESSTDPADKKAVTEVGKIEDESPASAVADAKQVPADSISPPGSPQMLGVTPSDTIATPQSSSSGGLDNKQQQQKEEKGSSGSSTALVDVDQASKAEAEEKQVEEEEEVHKARFVVKRKMLKPVANFRAAVDSKVRQRSKAAAEAKQTRGRTNTAAAAFDPTGWKSFALLEPRVREQILEQYSFSLKNATGQADGLGDNIVSEDGKLKQKIVLYLEKLQYMKSELLADLGPPRWTTQEFWATLVLLMVVFWIRIYSHYIGQWLLLSSMKVPILNFEALPYTVLIEYSIDNIDVSVEAMVFAWGTGMNLFILLFFVLALYAMQKTLYFTPDLASRFVFCWGIATILDPYLTFVIDLLIGWNTNVWTGDMFKLYNMFVLQDGSGLIGIFVSVVILLVLFLLSVGIFYLYLLRIHMNGRMLDVHYRLNNGSRYFYTPNDMEVSLATLQWVVEAAKIWSDRKGTKMKIATTKYIVRDPIVPEFNDVTIHIGIYRQTLEGERELHRHFVRKNDGTICEIFDAVKSLGIREYEILEKKFRANMDLMEEKEAAAGLESKQADDSSSSDDEREALLGN